MGISRECMDKALYIYRAHENAHAALSLVGRRTPGEAEVYLNRINQELYDAGLGVAEKMELNSYLAEARKQIRAGSREAVAPLNGFLDRTLELMFEVAVLCECPKWK